MAILRSKHPDDAIPENLSCTEFIFQNFGKYGDRTAIIDAISGRSFSFNQIIDLTRRFSSALNKRGFQKGDVLAMYLPNVIEYPIIFHGVACLGGVITTVNPQYSPQDLARQLRTSRAKYLVTIPSLAVQAFRAGVLNGIRSVFVFGEAKGCESISSLLSDDGIAFPRNVKINPKNDVVALPFSSGTTGVSKGVMITHYNFIAQIRLPFKDGPPLEDMTTVLNVLPFYHIYGLAIILGGRLYVGSKLVVLQRFEPHTFLQAIQHYKVRPCSSLKQQAIRSGNFQNQHALTKFYRSCMQNRAPVTNAPLVPPLVLFLAKHPMVDKYDLSSLKSLSSRAAALAKDLEIGVSKRLPYLESVRQGFGMTELCGASHNIAPDRKMKPGSVGVLLPNLECKIIDPETGKVLGPNQDGEMCIRGPIVMKGYLGNPEATARTIDSDGWLHTGDIGYYDEDEYFFIVDRLKELIKYKGYQVPPAELEAILITHPNIDDVAVIGVPDRKAGELPKAFVVRQGDVTSEAIMEFVAERVAPQKKLRGGVEFVDNIPKSSSGKILRRLLRKQEKQKSHL
ncbi:hypothetical protein ACROYT_G039451 [Oculina patagonica]